DGHRRVIEHDGEDRDPAAHRGLEIEPGHAEGGVAHEVDAELLGGGELGPDDQAEAGAERVRLAPAEIAARRDRPVEGQELVARAPAPPRTWGMPGWGACGPSAEPRVALPPASHAARTCSRSARTCSRPA